MAQNDSRLVGRDGFLVTMAGYILLLTVAIRFAVPFINRAIPVELSDYYPVIVAFLAVFNGGLLGGTIVGFMLLEERENDTIRPLLVSPLPLYSYLTYRIVVPGVLSFLLVTAQILILSNLEPIPMFFVLSVSLGAAFTAPVVTLAFATLAQNRIQGFALLKFVGVGGFIVGGAWFVPEPWQYLVGVFPPYWISKAYWLALDGSSFWWAALLLGIALQAVLITWLKRRFSNVARRS